MRWKFWRDKGIGVVKCLKCKTFIATANPGERPKITKTYWDLCETCQNRERGIFGVHRPNETAIG